MSRPPTNEPFKPRFPGDRATAPTPLEVESQSAWDEFVRLTEAGGLTVPGEPASPRGPAAVGRVTLESTLLVARQRNRACPRPAAWQQLQALLPMRGRDAPPAAVKASEWGTVAPMQKRLLLRHQIEWAAATGALAAVHAFLSSLPDDQWEQL